MTRQAATKYLNVLLAANLIATLKRRWQKLHYLYPVPIHDVGERLIGKYRRAHLDALADLKSDLERKADDQ